MALETATYIDGLVATNPAASDAISTADDHLRLIKATIKATFPDISAPVTKTAAEINNLASQDDLAVVSNDVLTVANAFDAAAPFLVPSGGIIMWSGSIASIPSGWFLCDGENSTPDLRDRFIVGAGSAYAVDATGGSTTTTATGTISGSVAGTALTEAQMPKHFHQMLGPSFITSVPQNNGGSSGTFFGGTPDDSGQRYGTWSTGGSATSGSTSTGKSNGDSHTHAVGTLAFTGDAITSLPPYFALAYIMKA